MYWFKQQTYPNKELVILNDEEGVVYESDDPEVRVYNEPTRYPTLGDKRNAACELCNGEYIAVWDDDDISLPHRLMTTYNLMKVHNREWFNPRTLILPDMLVRESGFYHAVGMFTKNLFTSIGGYGRKNSGEDIDFDEKALQYEEERLGRKVIDAFIRTKPEDHFYIYREGWWCHASSVNNTTEFSKTTKDAFTDEMGGKLTPRMTHDYCKIFQKVLNNLKPHPDNPK